jgi:hypothetical protein
VPLLVTNFISSGNSDDKEAFTRPAHETQYVMLQISWKGIGRGLESRSGLLLFLVNRPSQAVALPRAASLEVKKQKHGKRLWIAERSTTSNITSG